MKDKDRGTLRAALVMLGTMGVDGTEGDDDVTRNHDWSTFLLAKVMYKDFTGPEWVPFSLWSARTDHTTAIGQVSEKLIFSAGAQEIWNSIEQSFKHPNDVAIELPLRIVEAQEQWKLLSKRKPSEHREHYLRLKAHATALATELGRIEELEKRETGERLDFMWLYDVVEKEIVYQNARFYNMKLRNTVSHEAAAKKLGYKPGDIVVPPGAKEWAEYNEPADPSMPESPVNLSLASNEVGPLFELLTGDDENWPGIVPGIIPTLRRLSDYFERESKKPVLKRPIFRNAQRNHFARALCSFFHTSFGNASPSIISDIVSIFHGQGITENEVSQMVKKLPPLPPDPRALSEKIPLK